MASSPRKIALCMTPRCMTPHKPMLPGLYITGTDTGIGKTFASVVLLHALRARGLQAVGMKPVASGCEWIDGGWCNDDALALQGASDPWPDHADANPCALPLATAPEIAARQAGIDIDLPCIEAAYHRLQTRAGVVVVEGSAAADQGDVVRALDLRVVLVVGLRLGCINHARLTARAIEADGVVLADGSPTTSVPEWNIAMRISHCCGTACKCLAWVACHLPAPCFLQHWRRASTWALSSRT